MNVIFRLYIEGGIDMEYRITDPRYGKGTVVKIEKSEEGYLLTVVFDEETVGVKTFLSLLHPNEMGK